MEEMEETKTTDALCKQKMDFKIVISLHDYNLIVETQTDIGNIFAIMNDQGIRMKRLIKEEAHEYISQVVSVRF